MSDMTTEHTQVLSAVCVLAVCSGDVYQAYWRWYLPLWAKRKVERLRFEEHAGIPPSPRDYHYAIAFDSSGFTVIDLRVPGHEAFGMRRRDISRVTAFKTYSPLIASAYFSLVPMVRELNWMSFLERLPQHLPGCKPWSEWFLSVASPAFEMRPTQVCDRGPLCATDEPIWNAPRRTHDCQEKLPYVPGYPDIPQISGKPGIPRDDPKGGESTGRSAISGFRYVKPTPRNHAAFSRESPSADVRQRKTEHVRRRAVWANRETHR
jgi:hypothetical protein